MEGVSLTVPRGSESEGSRSDWRKAFHIWTLSLVAFYFVRPGSEACLFPPFPNRNPIWKKALFSITKTLIPRRLVDRTIRWSRFPEKKDYRDSGRHQVFSVIGKNKEGLGQSNRRPPALPPVISIPGASRSLSQLSQTLLMCPSDQPSRHLFSLTRQSLSLQVLCVL